ncbi:MAG: TetR family transcriptional regulator [Clostridiales bacterium]|jgi:TetR/AcrR family acrAB operon transcriptional repressor|nr:TetR family transcriptional regulator [Clostridiales bacterium]
MKKTKEDMLITKQDILNAGFDCFFEKGFAATSLEAVAKQAGVTRGAIYWHFKNKMELYSAVVDMTLEKGDVADYLTTLPLDMTLEQRLNHIFWKSLGDNRYVDFVFKTMTYTIGREEFVPIYEKLRNTKRNLLKAIEKEIEIHVRLNGLTGIDIDSHAKGVYLLFEGLFLTKNVPIGVEISEEQIKFYLHIALDNLID